MKVLFIFLIKVDCFFHFLVRHCVSQGCWLVRILSILMAISIGKVILGVNIVLGEVELYGLKRRDIWFLGSKAEHIF